MVTDLAEQMMDVYLNTLIHVIKFGKGVELLEFMV